MAIRLRAQGLTVQQIAREMHVSPNTAKSMIQVAIERAGAKNSTHLVNIGWQQGWLP